MFGLRPSALFRSRWLALGWAIMICLSAIGFVSGRSEGGPAADAADAAAANAAFDALN